MRFLHYFYTGVKEVILRNKKILVNGLFTRIYIGGR